MESKKRLADPMNTNAKVGMALLAQEALSGHRNMNPSPLRHMRYNIRDTEKKLKNRCAVSLVEKKMRKLKMPIKSIIP